MKNTRCYIQNIIADFITKRIQEFLIVIASAIHKEWFCTITFYHSIWRILAHSELKYPEQTLLTTSSCINQCIDQSRSHFGSETYMASKESAVEVSLVGCSRLSFRVFLLPKCFIFFDDGSTFRKWER